MGICTTAPTRMGTDRTSCRVPLGLSRVGQSGQSSSLSIPCPSLAFVGSRLTSPRRSCLDLPCLFFLDLIPIFGRPSFSVPDAPRFRCHVAAPAHSLPRVGQFVWRRLPRRIGQRQVCQTSRSASATSIPLCLISSHVSFAVARPNSCSLSTLTTSSDISRVVAASLGLL